MMFSNRDTQSVCLVTGTLLLGTAMSLSSVSFAQSAPPAAQPASDGLEEIIVTAERRTSGVQKTPTAVSVRTGEELLQQGKTTMRQILEDVPSVAVTQNQGPFIGGSDTAGNNVTIRGIASNSTSSGSPSPTVPTTALYADGVYEGIGGNYDLARVEVLRGPQGTLYGRSATSGVVAAYTKDPYLETTSIDGTVEMGNYDLQHFSGAANVPVGETFAVRLAADQFSRDGYDSAQGGAVNRTAARVKALYQPVSEFSILLGAAIEDNDTRTGGVAANMTAPNTFNYTDAPIRSGWNRFTQYWANIDWDLGPVTLTYLPAIRRWKQDAEIYQNGPGGGGLNQLLKTPFDQFITHEAHLTSNDDGPLKWIVGGFYYDNRVKNTNDIRWTSSGGLLNRSNTKKETLNEGIFGEMTYSLRDDWRVTGGLRYDYTHVSTTQDYTNNLNYFCNTPLAAVMTTCAFAPPDSPQAGYPENNFTLSLRGADGSRKFNNTTYKARIEHDLTDANLMYAMVSSGFIPGDVQVAANMVGVPVANEYGAEQLTAYEIGSKNRFLGNRLQVNGSMFFYDYGGFRTSIRPDPLNPGTQVLLTVPAKVVGAELEMMYRFTPEDQISLNYSYTHARFSKAPSLFTQNVVEKDVVPGAIPHSINASYSHTFRLDNESGLEFRTDGHFLSAHNLDNISAQLGATGLKFIRVGDQFTGNVSATWTSSNGNYSVTGYVRNVTDNRYKTFVQLQTLQPVVNATGTQYDPRTFGVVVSARY